MKYLALAIKREKFQRKKVTSERIEKQEEKVFIFIFQTKLN